MIITIDYYISTPANIATIWGFVKHWLDKSDAKYAYSRIKPAKYDKSILYTRIKIHETFCRRV